MIEGREYRMMAGNFYPMHNIPEIHRDNRSNPIALQVIYVGRYRFHQ